MKYFYSFLILVGLALLSAYGIYYLNKSDLAKEFYVEESKPLAAVAVADKNPNEISILNFGDGMFGRSVGKAIHESGLDPFEFIKNSPEDIWQKADLIVLNLEGPISDASRCQGKAYSFRFEPDTADLLAKNKIGLVNLSNNHSYDCYSRGLSDTRIFLELAGVGHFGGSNVAESYIEKEVKGKVFAFVGIDLTIDNRFNPEYLDLIRGLKDKGDFVIVDIHWGVEYAKEPSSEQKIVGGKLIDAGADVVIGHHPHVIEPMEIYKDKPIFYSLGNFIFDQLEPENNEGVGVEITLDKNLVPAFQVLPYKIEKMEPKLLDKNAAEIFCADFLKNYSRYRTGNCGIKIN